MVAVVRLIADNSVDLAQTLHLGSVDWPRTGTLTDQQTEFLSLLELDVESAIYWFQQLGLANGYARDNLKRLWKATNGPEFTIADFKAEYPKLFGVLERTFGCLPSTTRQSEQAHGFLRSNHLLSMNRSLLQADIKYIYWWNELYGHREQRRQEVKLRESKTKKHNRTKNDQIMGADQMLSLMNRYSDVTLTDVPPELLNISQTNKGGQMVLDNKLKDEMLDDMDADTGKRRRLATDAEWWDEADFDSVVDVA